MCCVVLDLSSDHILVPGSRQQVPATRTWYVTVTVWSSPQQQFGALFVRTEKDCFISTAWQVFVRTLFTLCSTGIHQVYIIEARGFIGAVLYLKVANHHLNQSCACWYRTFRFCTSSARLQRTMLFVVINNRPNQWRTLVVRSDGGAPMFARLCCSCLYVLLVRFQGDRYAAVGSCSITSSSKARRPKGSSPLRILKEAVLKMRRGEAFFSRASSGVHVLFASYIPGT